MIPIADPGGDEVRPKLIRGDGSDLRAAVVDIHVDARALVI